VWGGCGWDPLAGVRCSVRWLVVVGALLSCPLPLDLLSCRCLWPHRPSHGRFIFCSFYPSPAPRSGTCNSLNSSFARRVHVVPPCAPLLPRRLSNTFLTPQHTRNTTPAGEVRLSLRHESQMCLGRRHTSPRTPLDGGRFCWGARGAPGARGGPSPVHFVRRTAPKKIDCEFLYAYQPFIKATSAKILFGTGFCLNSVFIVLMETN
jgi:hypothetical protein